MSITIDQFVASRPFLYHLTAEINFPRIRRVRRLDSAAVLLDQAQRLEELQKRRLEMVEIKIGRDIVSIRDQAPLKVNNLVLTDGASFGDFVAYLNHHIYFWPGDGDGPSCASGRNHFRRYRLENPVVLRIDTGRLIELNGPPLFSKCNSGSARYHSGHKAPRHRKMFVTAHEFDRRPSQVIEVTFRDGIAFPDNGVHFKHLANSRWIKF